MVCDESTLIGVAPGEDVFCDFNPPRFMTRPASATGKVTKKRSKKRQKSSQDLFQLTSPKSANCFEFDFFSSEPKPKKKLRRVKPKTPSKPKTYSVVQHPSNEYNLQQTLAKATKALSKVQQIITMDELRQRMCHHPTTPTRSNLCLSVDKTKAVHHQRSSVKSKPVLKCMDNVGRYDRFIQPYFVDDSCHSCEKSRKLKQKW